MSNSASLKKSESVASSVQDIVRNRAQSRSREVQKEQDETFANISSNTFFKVMFDEKLSPEDR